MVSTLCQTVQMRAARGGKMVVWRMEPLNSQRRRLGDGCGSCAGCARATTWRWRCSRASPCR